LDFGISIENWSTLALVLILGAMTPGPSLALVVRNTIFGGRWYGITTGIGHGIGFSIYAFAAATGIAVVVGNYPKITGTLHVIGFIVLLYLAINFLRVSSTDNRFDAENEEVPERRLSIAFIQGFSLAFFNPKILAWMLTMFVPFIDASMSTQTLMGMGFLGLFTDGGWYMAVATILSQGRLLDVVRQHEAVVTRAIGVVLLFYSVSLVFRFGWL
jgi:threonine/homoserine/homoserine lactone efflux protein